MPQQQSSTECGMAKADDGTRICSFHKQPLIQMASYGGNAGLEQFGAWMCPVSKRPIFQVGAS